MTTPLVGQSIRRFEDRRFLTGGGRYMADIVCPGALHVHFVRSPHAHAVLLGVDAGAAREMPGIHGIFTAADLAALGPIPCTTAVPSEEPMRVPFRAILATDRVRYVGEAVAFVVAETAVQAQDAAEQVLVDYDPLPCVTEAEDALAPGAPQLWDEIPGNLSYRFNKGDRAAVKAAMAKAAHVAALELVNNRLIITPLEHRGALAEYDPATEGFTLTISGQGVHGIRRDLAKTVFNLPLDRVHVICPDVGGGFGVKNPTYPEYAVVMWAARELGRPARWASGHGEDFVSTAHGRDNATRARLGLDGQGRFLALDVETVANLGAAMSTGGPGSSTNAPGNAMGGGYTIPAVFMTVRGAYTNTVPLDAYRGAGKPEAAYLLERLVDEAARLTGIDRVELRRRNLVRDFPHRTSMSTTIDCGRFADNLDPALAAADATGFPNRRTASTARGRLRGLGVTCFLETARGAPNEGAEIKFLPGGRVSLHLGTQSNGQGHETSFPQIAADRLGLPLEAFQFIQADTRLVRDGNGHGGARSLHMGGSALVDAIGLVMEKARPVAARLLQAQPEEVSFAGGHFTVAERSVAVLEVARAAAEDPAGDKLDSYHWTLLDKITFPNGCHIAEVEVDPETGVVTLLRYTAADDFGTAINPLLLIGQVQGGVAQGIGQAMMEHTVYDPDSGQLLSGSYMDYAVPHASDLPDLDIHLHGVPTASNPLGVKGAGQAGAIAAPQAVVAAVLDALAPLGVHHVDMPLTPERVWRAISAGRAAN
ncbi:xanthine dehydrogenase family protein molybdopterin-binding subunit [Acidisphaera sp. L21]|uniref:xanthine dehydrogenase family protein molybdopterin-binding subunit n=1 Tax=Acidisphaera sp. L21 TaxID=1641851 RepID=UPI0020B10F8E|nr:xanthine dehydrogenase family protein molybdopterin-binding subunit [Acidisphaera sp. L21]